MRRSLVVATAVALAGVLVYVLAAPRRTASAPTNATDAAPERFTNATRDTLGVVSGVPVYRGGYGSALALAADGSGDFYMLTDRGPNIDAVGGGKSFAFPDYSPRIVKVRLTNGALAILGEITLRRANGAPITGIPLRAGACGSTGEAPTTLDGRTLPHDDSGLDSEGLVALADGTFWISDEYGPFVVHVDADGKEMQRLGPCDGGLPPVYAKRRRNRGMEGLTLTPDGAWLVGIMQAPLQNPSADGVNDVSRLTRVLFRNISTGAMREYAYLLDDPVIEGVSEILALTDTRFLVLERDADLPLGQPASKIKRVYEIDITDATEISALGALAATPIAGGKTLEQATLAELTAAGIVPVTKALRIDLLTAGFPHDKSEGMALGAGNVLFISNDDDFGITDGPSSTITPKVLPATNKVDFVEIWKFRLK